MNQNLLSPRQYELCHALHRGETNKEIAVRMRIEEKTVKSMLRMIMDRVGIQSRTRAELAVWFYKEFMEKR